MNPVASPADNAAVPLSPEMLRALSELHDLQLDEIGVLARWPWLIVAVVSAGAALLAWLWWRRPERRWLRRLRQIERTYRADGARSPAAAAGPALVAAIAALLREAAIHPRHSPRMPAGLAGENWLRWLDEQAPHADRGAFVSGVGRDFLHWPFVACDRMAAPVGFDPARAEALLTLAARWLRARA